MEAFLYAVITTSAFFLGMSLGAIMENHRLIAKQLINRLNSLETTTQEMSMSVADRYHEPLRTTGTLYDYELREKEETEVLEDTQDIPIIEKYDYR